MRIYAYTTEINKNINKNILLILLPFLLCNYSHCSEYDKLYVWFPYSKNTSRTLSFLNLKPRGYQPYLHFLKGSYYWAISYSPEYSVTLWSPAWVTLSGLIQPTFWMSSKCQALCQLVPEAALLSRSSWSSSCHLSLDRYATGTITTVSCNPRPEVCCWVCATPEKEGPLRYPLLSYCSQIFLSRMGWHIHKRQNICYSYRS